jgi:4-hydroxy-3-methylbut-2-enyl diphosphate reductase IspH
MRLVVDQLNKNGVNAVVDLDLSFKPSVFIANGYGVSKHTIEAIKKFPSIPLFIYEWDLYPWTYPNPLKRVEYKFRRLEFSNSKKLQKLSEEEKNLIKETQEKEKQVIKKPKKTIQCEKDEINNISSKLEAMNVEDLAKILIETKKTRLLDF